MPVDDERVVCRLVAVDADAVGRTEVRVAVTHDMVVARLAPTLLDLVEGALHLALHLLHRLRVDDEHLLQVLRQQLARVADVDRSLWKPTRQTRFREWLRDGLHF